MSPMMDNLVMLPEPEQGNPQDLLARGQVRGDGERCLPLQGGAEARINADDVLEVVAPDGSLVFEYDPSSGRQRVFAPQGRLEIAAPQTLTLRASERIELDARELELRGRENLSLKGGSARSSARSSVRLGPDSLDLAADRMELATQEADWTLGDASLQGNRAEVSFKRASMAVGRLEAVTRTLVQRARNVYRTVEKLSQLRAGRVRTVVEGSHVCRANKASIHAEQDVRVQAEKIHLG
ncbi:hypothetical protein ABI59_02645 [Acidobacteria bacterium Mor1]|nr:hypothetical protein ABI59_02645 [Acidobacteria bacterium Mor1]